MLESLELAINLVLSLGSSNKLPTRHHSPVDAWRQLTLAQAVLVATFTIAFAVGNAVLSVWYIFDREPSGRTPFA